MTRSRTAARGSKNRRVASVPVDRAIARLTDSARRGELVVIAGTGVSMGLTNAETPALSWKGLIRDGFAYGVKKGKINTKQYEAWEAQLNSEDLDDLLGAAEFMGRKLDAPTGDLYSRWLESIFKGLQPTNERMAVAVRAIRASGVPLCTLNYDHLLEQVTGLPAITLGDVNKVTEWMRCKDPSQRPGILHIHGSWDTPRSCILGIRDYETTIGNDLRDLIQRSLASFSQLLFIGCGDTFADPNFAALIKWLRGKMQAAVPQHYALVSDTEMARRHADPAWHGFVEPLSYGTSQADLPEFLLRSLPAPTPAAKKDSVGSSEARASTSEHVRLLADYRAFLLRDCGMMTIEGVRADMDTAQRRFELERLFVPLKVKSFPPEIPENDPQREQKLLKWSKEEPRPFGNVFAKHKRLALLALPGGGKTLLMKRLAVAYADPGRRQASKDALPNYDLTPVLIRCREWREHIHRPIPTLLQSISDITGHAPLAGLIDALLPLFNTGRILLLVDGLDEIHDDALRSIFVDHLEAFLDQYKLTRLVVTSREAGFSLVAPCLARFCKRCRVAPLEPDAITALCDHWHRIMTGESPEGRAEADEVAQQLLQNASLLRLAENPLLLTMLLVVKRGAGRLPPDRVSLYGRAVEVLLDTWNIKGHDPLNPKEAVPQLAFVAFQLMRAGKQTATEKELLELLEEARENVPQIRRYAKDMPHEFLRRVEIRSSLVVEAGHQAEGGRTVPFYQFRHLTFQEYLAAVAAVEGHYKEYEKTDTVLTPLRDYLTAEEWKEVIPMAAVLARKQAEPLVAALVAEGNEARRKVEAGQGAAGNQKWLSQSNLPPPVGRVIQCLLEEAESAPETLSNALQLAAFFRKGGSQTDWHGLCRGPYGKELLHQAWLLYRPMQWPGETWLVNTCALFAMSWHLSTHKNDNERQAELYRLLRSDDDEEIARGLFICIELLRRYERSEPEVITVPVDLAELILFRDDPALWVPAALVNGLARGQLGPGSSRPVLDRLLALYLSGVQQHLTIYPAFALGLRLANLSRHEWVPAMTETQLMQVRLHFARATAAFDYLRGELDFYHYFTSLLISFHAGDICSDEELAARLFDLKDAAPFKATAHSFSIDNLLEQMGDAARKYVGSSNAGRKRGSKRG